MELAEGLPPHDVGGVDGQPVVLSAHRFPSQHAVVAALLPHRRHLPRLGAAEALEGHGQLAQDAVPRLLQIAVRPPLFERPSLRRRVGRRAQLQLGVKRAAGNSDLSAEEEEDDAYKTRQQTLSFFDERYEYAACSFPAQHEQFRAEASHILRVHNEKLLRSFCCFAAQYIAASCPKDADDFKELRETAKTLPDQDLLEAGMQNSFFPRIDLFRRDRSFYMYRVYKNLWGKELELSEPKLNLWFFLDCVFRYLGNHLFFTDVLLHPEWFVADRSIYAEGLTTKTRSRVVGAVEDAFRLAAGSRRSVRSMFANLDGRRRTFGKSMDLVRVGADTRFVDHAVTALKLWAESAQTFWGRLPQCWRSCKLCCCLFTCWVGRAVRRLQT